MSKVFYSLKVGILFCGFFCVEKIYAQDEILYPTLQVQREVPDVVVQGIFDVKAQQFLIERLRDILKEVINIDPFRKKFDQTIIVRTSLGNPVKGFADVLLDSSLGFESTQGMIEIQMKGLEYHVKHADLNVNAISASDTEGLGVKSFLELSDIEIKVDEMEINFLSPASIGTATGFYKDLWIKLYQPSLYSEKLKSLSMDTEFRVIKNENNELVIKPIHSTFDTFKSIDLMQLRKDLVFSPGDLSLAQMSEMELQLGALRNPFRTLGLSEVLDTRKEQIARLMLRPLAQLIQTLPERILEEKVQSINVGSSFSFDLAKLDFHFHSFGKALEDQLRLNLNIEVQGDDPSVRQSIFSSSYQRSLGRIRELIETKQATVVISIDQEAINRIAKRVLEEKFINKLPKDLKLGPKKIFFTMDTKRNNAQGAVVIDIIKKVGWFFPGLLLGKSKIHFSLVLYPSVFFSDDEQNPMLNLNVTEVDLSDEVLLNGVYGVESNIKKLRLNQKVRNSIKDYVTKELSKRSLSIPLVNLKGTSLSFVKVESDLEGRLNILLNLNPENNPDVRGFWKLVPEFIKRWLSKRKSNKT